MEGRNLEREQAMIEGELAKERFSESLALLAGRLIKRRTLPDPEEGKETRKRNSGSGAAA
ncbi:MAG: hypothetical protein LC114_10890 [Bryobacterales bacterium]|nr:hypothetical protein [Bryobacterales bacterium]